MTLMTHTLGFRPLINEEDISPYVGTGHSNRSVNATGNFNEIDKAK